MWTATQHEIVHWIIISWHTTFIQAEYSTPDSSRYNESWWIKIAMKTSIALLRSLAGSLNAIEIPRNCKMCSCEFPTLEEVEKQILSPTGENDSRVAWKGDRACQRVCARDASSPRRKLLSSSCAGESREINSSVKRPGLLSGFCSPSDGRNSAIGSVTSPTAKISCIQKSSRPGRTLHIILTIFGSKPHARKSTLNGVEISRRA